MRLKRQDDGGNQKVNPSSSTYKLLEEADNMLKERCNRAYCSGSFG